MTIKDNYVSEDDPKCYCPRWSSLMGKKTECLKENCTFYVPPFKVENTGEILDGLCRETGILDCLAGISLSLSILSGQIGLEFPEKNANEEQNAPEERIYG